MAREKALNVADYTNQDVMDNLAETLNGVIENIQVSAVSEVLKNRNGSGNPESGSVEYKRFANATLQDKGTARENGKGNKVKAKPVIINIDTDKEIVEEFQKKDLKLYGIDGMAEKRKDNFKKRVTAFLDKTFFANCVAEGTKITTAKTDVQDIIDEMIVTAKETSSDFIDGIDAEDLAIVLNGTYRKGMKTKLDELPNGTAPSNGRIGMYDSIEVFESNRLPEGINAIVMLKGAVAQPYYLSEYDVEKVPFDDALALETFLYTGIGALNSEAIYYSGTATVSL